MKAWAERTCTVRQFEKKWVDHQTIARWLQESTAHRATVPDPKPGRPPCLSQEQKRAIHKLAEIHEACHETFSTSSVTAEVAPNVKLSHATLSSVATQVGIAQHRSRSEATAHPPINPPLQAAKWVHKTKRCGARLDKWWFDEKPLKAGALPKMSTGLCGQTKYFPKPSLPAVNYTAWIVCNSKCGLQVVESYAYEHGVYLPTLCGASDRSNQL